MYIMSNSSKIWLVGQLVGHKNKFKLYYMIVQLYCIIMTVDVH